MKHGLYLLPALTLISSLSIPALAATDAAKTPADSISLADELRDGFSSRINVLGFGAYRDIREESPLNQGNALGIPRRQWELDLRPDFNLNYRQFEFGLKPRLEYARTKTYFSDGNSSNTTDRSFINEGFVRYRMTDRLLAIYGRENLQWGPSALLSPSNPFNANNGRNNPYIELPGLDYARVVAIPNSQFTMSLIANTDPGRLEQRQSTPFEKTYAAKLDYTGDAHYFSVLASHRRNERNRLGFFGGWNASDALLLYTEGSGARKKDDTPDTRSDYQLLMGGAYTLEAGPTITLEYFHNNNGCTLTPVNLCDVQQPLVQDPHRPFLRRRYALLQYVDTKIGGNMNLVVRLIKNIDDGSSQLIGNLEYELGQHWQLYFVPTFFRGERDSEFGGLLRRYAFVGASYTF